MTNSVGRLGSSVCPSQPNSPRDWATRRRPVYQKRTDTMSISDTSGRDTSRPIQPARLASTRPGEHDDPLAVVQEVSGFDPGPGAGSSTPSPPSRPDFGPDPGIVTPPDPSPPSRRPCTQWVIWEVWFTVRDERVCPECGPLHGQRFQRGHGPQPPLHTSCRCIRREVDRECVSRRVGGGAGGTNY